MLQEVREVRSGQAVEVTFEGGVSKNSWMGESSFVDRPPAEGAIGSRSGSLRSGQPDRGPATAGNSDINGENTPRSLSINLDQVKRV